MARGGYRPGAGRPKGSKTRNTTKPSIEPTSPESPSKDAPGEDLGPLAYMLKVMNDPKAPDDRRDRMAIAAAPFVHARKGIGQGKKAEKAERAKEASTGRFAPSKPPPRLSLVGKFPEGPGK